MHISKNVLVPLILAASIVALPSSAVAPAPTAQAQSLSSTASEAMRLAAGHALALTTPATAGHKPAAGKPAGPKVASGYAILVDAKTGTVMWSRHAATSRPPASLTKMLTALLVRSSLPLNTVAVAGRDAARAPPTRLSLKPGQKITISQALAALLVVSANDVAVLLADRAAGTKRRFERAMNLASEQLGLGQSSWHSPNGLDAPGHRSSAFDLAILARAVLRDPWLAKMVRTEEIAFTTPDHHRHELHAHSLFLRAYKGAVGVKTGFTDDAGRCLAAAATRNGRALIAVVLHSPNPPADAMQLMNWGFGAGRKATTGKSLPPYVAVPSVQTLLAPPTTTIAPVASSPPAGDATALGTSLEDLPQDVRLPLVVGAGAGVVILAGTGFAIRRRRRHPAAPQQAPRAPQ
jgi:serine-type D-Ala-D-Ala carboxypeptidase (penicillin-binding protein 5/6)